jgi:hypothetical protein
LDDAYFRTESRLVKDKETLIELSKENSFIIDTNNNNNSNNAQINYLNNNDSEYVYTGNFNSNQKFKRETRYHFGTSNVNNTSHNNNNSKVNFSYRLPALEKQISHSLQNTMDLDEDLPMNPVSQPDTNNQRQIYTSPGDRIISPVKRPQAPSPASSAYRRKTRQNSDSDSDNDLIS